MSRVRRSLLAAAIACCVSSGCLALADPGAASSTEEPFVPGPASQAEAQRIAEATLATVSPPPGSAQLPAAPSEVEDGGGTPETERGERHEVTLHERWQVPGGWRSVLIYLRAHPPAGAKLTWTGEGGVAGKPTGAVVDYSWPLSVGYLDTRRLTEGVVVGSEASTELLLEAKVMWLIPRSSSERVPAGAHEVDVEVYRPGHRPSTFLAVTDPAKVSALVREVDGLPIEQPGLAYSCGAELVDAPLTAFVFRARRGGRALAAAIQSARVRGRTFGCDSMSFTVEGRPRARLLEGPELVVLAERLLKAKLAPRR